MIDPEVSTLLARYEIDAAKLKDEGWDPEWFSISGDGPYVACRVFDETCPCCGGNTSGWTLLNIETATGASHTWHGDNAQYDAEEHAGEMNAAWRAGATSHSSSLIG